MSIESAGRAGRWTRRLTWASGAVLALGGAAVGAASLMELEGGGGGQSMAVSARRFEPMDSSVRDIRPLLVKMAGTTLIRPAQVRAAVMDRGLAKKLLSRLKLQGVIKTGAGYTAYIRVEKQGVETVREGGTVLELSVDKIEPGRVTLSLDGVVVELVQ